MARKARATKKPTKKEMAEVMKSMRANKEITDFYRFVHENDLREEAAILLRAVVSKSKSPKRILQ